MASSWLGIKNCWENEIVVNEKQGKDDAKYTDMLREAFLECHRVLKPGKYMTVAFHSPELTYWNRMAYAVLSSGFEYVDAVYVSPPKEYTDWLYARNPGKMRGDIYVTFRKPLYIEMGSSKEEVKLSEVIMNVIIPEIKRTIIVHGGQADYDTIMRNVTLELLRKGLLHKKELLTLDLEKILDKYFERGD
jgi:hypothetical protein